MALCSLLHAGIIITEVCPNPPGGSSEVPGDLSHEYIEFYNNGPDTVNLCRCHIKTGSWGSTSAPDSNNIQVWQGDSLRDIGRGTALVYDSLLLPGEYGVLLGRKYVSAPESSWYRFPAGTHIFATRKTYLRSSGLSNSSAWVRLCSPENLSVSMFNSYGSQSMDPGEAFTWQRLSPEAADAPLGWRMAAPTLGAPYPFGMARKNDSTLAFSEFMCDPAEGGAEWIELYNYGSDTVFLQGWRIRAGNSEGYVTLADERIAPNGYCIVREPGNFTDGYFSDCLAPVIAAQAWDGLRRDADVLVIKNSSGGTVDSLQYAEGWFGIKKGVSLERISAQAPANTSASWRHCASARGATPGYANSAADVSIGTFSFSLLNRRIVPGSSDGRAHLNMFLNVPPEGRLTLKIFDLKGRLVRLFYDNRASVTERSVVWDGLSGQGMRVPSGAYLLYCRYAGPGQNVTRSIPIALGSGHAKK
ncbi:MAG: lamin tail domain-containing protein [Fibrobacterota bacterium]